MKISEIKSILEASTIETLPAFIEEFSNDDRTGVFNLVNQARSRIRKYEEEVNRIETMRIYEEKYNSYEYIGGIDEVGRGPLAGPVVTCALILPKGERILYANDSKKLSASKREELYDIIMEKAISVSIGMESPKVIDEINILQATYKAMRTSINGLSVRPDVMLNDAVNITGIDILQVPIIKGDAKSLTIACASIVAKVTRDRMMEEYSKLYPEYDFGSNKGYGSEKHIAALIEHGPCPIHRASFIKNWWC